MKERGPRNPDTPIVPRNEGMLLDWVQKFQRSYVRNYGRLHDRFEEIAKAFEFMKDPTGFEDPDDSTISFDDGTRTFTIAPVDEGYNILVNGDLIVKTATETCIITDTEGLWVVYFDEEGGIDCTQAGDIADLIEDNVLIAWIYWDADNNTAIYLGDERHGLMPHHVHKLWHLTHGTNYISGLGIADILSEQSGDSDSHAEFSVASGVIVDEDIWIDIAAYLTSTNRYVFYKSGAAGNWRRSAATTAGVITTGSGRAAWNEFTGGAWQQTEVTNNDFVLAHVVATNDPDNPIIIVQGEADYNTRGQARDGANEEINDLITAGLPFQEFVFIGTIIYQTGNGYANSWKSRIRTNDDGEDYTDWRQQPLTPGSPPGDHQNLTGRDTAASHPGTAISLDTTNFDGALSTEDDVQEAFDALDDAVASAAALDYSGVSSNDAATDVTGAELEELSDGSETALHIHDARYYTEAEVDSLLGGYLPLTGGTLTGALNVEGVTKVYEDLEVWSVGGGSRMHRFDVAGTVQLCESGGSCYVDGNGRIYLRLSGDSSNYGQLRNVADNQTVLQHIRASGDTYLDLDAICSDGTSAQRIRLFRNNATTGTCAFYVHNGASLFHAMYANGTGQASLCQTGGTANFGGQIRTNDSDGITTYDATNTSIINQLYGQPSSVAARFGVGGYRTDIYGELRFQTNDEELTGKEVGGTFRNLIKMNTSDEIILGEAALPNQIKMYSDAGLNVFGNSFHVFSREVQSAGALTTPQASLVLQMTEGSGTTVGDGCGPDMLFQGEDDGGNDKYLARISGYFEDVTAASAVGGLLMRIRSTSGDTFAGTFGMKIIPATHVIQACDSAAPADADMENESCCFYYDSSGPSIKVKHKDSGGTVRTGTVASIS